MNPLFADNDEDKKKPVVSKHDYVLPNRHGRKITPLNPNITREPDHKPTPPQAKVKPHVVTHAPAPKKDGGANPAVDLIRRKLETLYTPEPSAVQEMQAAQAEPVGIAHQSKHQAFMHDLSTSGKSLAQIQTAWHHYYSSLSDHEKHEVWQEFYSHNNRQPSPYTQYVNQVAQQPAAIVTQAPIPTQAYSYRPIHPMPTQQYAQHYPQQQHPVSQQSPIVVADHLSAIPVDDSQRKISRKSLQGMKKQIVKHVNISAQKQAKAKQHLRSLFFGVVSGAIVLLIVLFGLFNEMVIAPFIRPSQSASATPIILSTNGVAPTSTPEVIIPKINVQIPVDYSLTSNDEESVQKGLENGVVHYPTTVKPGEKGNAAFFGHSSNNIFNPGKYKFAFVLLKELVPGDIFYLTYEGKVYTYKVYDKQIVKPNQVDILNNVEGKTATAILITCDPPGTTLNRLVVWGEQVNPDPNSAVDPTATAVQAPAEISGNGPSLWQRLTGWISGGDDTTSSE